jgi:hypothetical protein
MDKALKTALDLYQNTERPIDDICQETGVYKSQLYDAIHADPTIKTRHERLPFDAGRIAQMYRSDIPVRTICEATGRSTKTVYKILKQLDIPLRRNN